MKSTDPIKAPIAQQPEVPSNPEAENLKGIFSEMIAESSGLKTVASGAATDVVSERLVAQFAKSARARLRAAKNERVRWNLLRLAGNDLSRLRRGDHSAGRLALQPEKWEEEIREVKEARWRREHPQEWVGLSPEAFKKIEQALNLL